MGVPAGCCLIRFVRAVVRDQARQRNVYLGCVSAMTDCLHHLRRKTLMVVTFGHCWLVRFNLELAMLDNLRVDASRGTTNFAYRAKAICLVFGFVEQGCVRRHMGSAYLNSPPFHIVRFPRQCEQNNIDTKWTTVQQQSPELCGWALQYQFIRFRVAVVIAYGWPIIETGQKSQTSRVIWSVSRSCSRDYSLFDGKRFDLHVSPLFVWPATSRRTAATHQRRARS